MNLKISLITLILLTSHGLSAKEMRQTKPENVGMSSERLLRMEEIGRASCRERV